MLLLVALACKPDLPVALPVHTEGGVVQALVRFADTPLFAPAVVEVGLWGPRFATDGLVPAQAEVEGNGLWLYFPLRTPSAEGTAALRLEGDTLALPLGARAGEFEQRLPLRAGDLDPAAIQAADAAGQEAVDDRAAAFARGDYQLRDAKGAMVGALHLGGDSTVTFVHPRFITTDGQPQRAAVSVDGADLLLRFAVEPSLQGERGLLRVNLAAGLAVLPVGPAPDPQDILFSLVEGAADPVALAETAATVAERALVDETLWLSERLPRLAMALRRADGSCATIDEIDPAWKMSFSGYTVTPEVVPGGCAVGVQPVVAQHGRRLAAWSDFDGPLMAGVAGDGP